MTRGRHGQTRDAPEVSTGDPGARCLGSSVDPSGDVPLRRRRPRRRRAGHLGLRSLEPRLQRRGLPRTDRARRRRRRDADRHRSGRARDAEPWTGDGALRAGADESPSSRRAPSEPISFEDETQARAVDNGLLDKLRHGADGTSRTLTCAPTSASTTSRSRPSRSGARTTRTKASSPSATRSRSSTADSAHVSPSRPAFVARRMPRTRSRYASLTTRALVSGAGAQLRAERRRRLGSS